MAKQPQAPQKPEQRPLEWAETCALIDELAQRYKTFVFSGQRVPPRATTLITERYHYGCLAACLGLSYDLMQQTHSVLSRET